MNTKLSTKNVLAKGFSLVEMLVVIAVIGIIAAIAIPSIGSINDNARNATAKRNAQNIASVYASSVAAGVKWTAPQLADIPGTLVTGVTTAPTDGSDPQTFQVTGLSTAAQTDAVHFLTGGVYTPDATRL